MRTTRTNQTFRLTKRNKTLLALSGFKTQEQRDSFRHMMIDAQVAASVIVKSAKERNAIKGE